MESPVEGNVICSLCREAQAHTRCSCEAVMCGECAVEHLRISREKEHSVKSLEIDCDSGKRHRKRMKQATLNMKSVAIRLENEIKAIARRVKTMKKEIKETFARASKQMETDFQHEKENLLGEELRKIPPGAQFIVCESDISEEFSTVHSAINQMKVKLRVNMETYSPFQSPTDTELVHISGQTVTFSYINDPIFTAQSESDDGFGVLKADFPRGNALRQWVSGNYSEFAAKLRPHISNFSPTCQRVSISLCILIAVLLLSTLLFTDSPNIDQLLQSLPKSTRDVLTSSDFGEVHLTGKPAYYKGGVYHGQWDESDRRSGFGLYLYRDTTVYKGYWRADKRWGKGVMVWPNGNYYIGDWENDSLSGYGVKKYYSGCEYGGSWANNKYAGFGYISCTQTESLRIGFFENGQLHGLGGVFAGNNSVFFGHFHGGVKSGFGVSRLQMGDLYYGDYSNGVRAGFGTYIWPNGTSYNGQWASNVMHGYGRTTPPGVKLCGKWSNGAVISSDFYMDSEGKDCDFGAYSPSIPNYLTSDSAKSLREFGDYPLDKQENILFDRGFVRNVEGVYLGQWNSEGMRHGVGMQNYSSGAVYQGEWREGMRWGSGRLIEANGDVYIGSWRSDFKSGFGTLYYRSLHETYTGEWVENVWHGLGHHLLNFTKSTDFSMGFFANGTLNGVAVMTISSQKESEELLLVEAGEFSVEKSFYIGEFANGKKEGRGVFVWDDGRLYRGWWGANKKEIAGVIQYPGTMFSGGWKNDRRYGQGVCQECKCDSKVVCAFKE